MHLRATENAVAGHIWPAGRYLPTPVVDSSIAATNSTLCVLAIHHATVYLHAHHF